MRPQRLGEAGLDQTGRDAVHAVIVLAVFIRGETAWTVLDAANDLGDMLTVDACRRVIDADLRGDMPAMSDMELVTAFFN